jgi:hypothetical protein
MIHRIALLAPGVVFGAPLRFVQSCMPAALGGSASRISSRLSVRRKFPGRRVDHDATRLLIGPDLRPATRATGRPVILKHIYFPKYH